MRYWEDQRITVPRPQLARADGRDAEGRQGRVAQPPGRGLRGQRRRQRQPEPRPEPAAEPQQRHRPPRAVHGRVPTGGAAGGGGAGSGGAGEGGDEGGAIEAYAPQQDRFSQSSGERYCAALKQLVPANGVLGWDESTAGAETTAAASPASGQQQQQQPGGVLHRAVAAAGEAPARGARDHVPRARRGEQEWKDRMEKRRPRHRLARASMERRQDDAACATSRIR